MKKTVLSLIAAALALLTAVTLCACTGTDTPANTGADTKTAQTGGVTADTAADTGKTADTADSTGGATTENGGQTPTGEVKTEDFYGTYYGENGVIMKIDEGGTGIFTEDGVDYEATWMINDGTLVVWDYNDHNFSGSLIKANSELSGLWQSAARMRFSSDPAVVTDPSYPNPPYNPTVFEPKTAELYGGFEITILGAELFRNSERDEAIRIYFDVKNLNDTAKSFYDVYGTVLETGVIDHVHCSVYDCAEAEAVNTPIQPGEALRCASEFYCKWDITEPLTFEVQNEDYRFAKLIDAVDLLDPGTYTIGAQFDMQKLPAFQQGGLPAKP